MAPLIFSRAVLAGRPIEVFNHGKMQRDFTFVEDIVAGVLGALDTPSSEPVPHRVFNLGNHTPVELEYFIDVIAQAAGRPAEKVYRPMQPGDMIRTMADTQRAQAAFGFDPATPVERGLPQVVNWCRQYFGKRAQGLLGLGGWALLRLMARIGRCSGCRGAAGSRRDDACAITALAALSQGRHAQSLRHCAEEICDAS